jgi:hypothetical protein
LTTTEDLSACRCKRTLIQLLTVNNHDVHKICSKLKFCENEPTNADKIEKTLSTMLPVDRVLQQQYQVNKFTHYSQLTHTLTQVEKHDEILMKSHHKHSTGAAPLPQVRSV